MAAPADPNSLIAYLLLWAGGITLLIVLARMVILRVNVVTAVVALILVNALADVTTNYVEEGGITPGAIRFVFLVATLLLIVPRARCGAVGKAILAFCGYTWLLLWASSNITYSTGIWFKVCLPMLLLPVGYTFFGAFRSRRSLVRGILGAVAIIVAQVWLAQVFRLGDSVYIKDSFYLGGGLIEVTYTLVLALVMLPYLLPVLRRRERLWALGLSLVSLVAVLLYVRRGSYAGLAGAVMVYTFMTPRRTPYLIGAAVLGVALLAASPLYGDLLLDRIEGRGIRDRALQEEGRFGETLYVAEDLRQGSPFQVAFGTELFNSPDYFRSVMHGRQLHVDYNILLHGAGVVGLGLYLLVFLLIMLRAYRSSRGGRPQARVYMALVFALCVMNAVLGLSGALEAAGYRTLLFLSLGALLRQIEMEAWRPAQIALPPVRTCPAPRAPAPRLPVAIPSS